MRQFVTVSVLAIFASAHLVAEKTDTGKKSKTPHATIVVRPGPPVKPTGPAKPVGNQKSDWGEKEQR